MDNVIPHMAFSVNRAAYIVLVRAWMLCVLVGYAHSRLWRWMKGE